MAVIRKIGEQAALRATCERYEACLIFVLQLFEVLFYNLAFLFTGTLTPTFWAISVYSLMVRVCLDSGNIFK